MDGIGPNDIEIDSLVERVKQGREEAEQPDDAHDNTDDADVENDKAEAAYNSFADEPQPKINEIIFALASTMEGDTTNFYISRRLRAFNDLRLSVIARGISIGDELQYTDEVTLGQSILNRTALK